MVPTTYLAPSGTSSAQSAPSQYDSLGRMQQQIDPNTGTRTNTYTAFDELKTALDARGQLSEYFYDTSGRLERVQKLRRTTELIYDEPGPDRQRSQQGEAQSKRCPRHPPAIPGGHRTRYAYEPVLGGISNRGLRAKHHRRSRRPRDGHEHRLRRLRSPQRRHLPGGRQRQSSQDQAHLRSTGISTASTTSAPAP